MRKTIKVRVASTVRRVGSNSVRVETKVSNGSTTRRTSKTIRLK